MMRIGKLLAEIYQAHFNLPILLLTIGYNLNTEDALARPYIIVFIR